MQLEAEAVPQANGSLYPLKAHPASSQRDGPNEASRVCSPAHLPPGEPEEETGHHQLTGGAAAADPGGLCNELCANAPVFLV